MSLHRILSPLLAFALVAPVAPGQERQEPGPADEDDWLEFYYRNPRPERLVTEVRNWSSTGVLDNERARPAIIAFLSQVFRRNREHIAEWYDALRGLPEDHRRVIHTALLYSRTSEADDLLRERFGKSFETQRKELPKILELNLAQQNTLDMLWGFFYATGSRSAIRRIVWSFRFEDAPENPEFAKVPEDYVPLYKALPDAAAWMLNSNARRHPRVIEICRELLAEGEDLAPTERRRLEELVPRWESGTFADEP